MLLHLLAALRTVERALLSASILAIAALTVANVVGRTCFGVSLAALEEITGFLVVLVTFVGLSHAAGLGRHIRMTALTDQLPPRPRKGLLVVSHLGTALLLLAMAWWAFDYVETLAVLGSRTPALRVPRWMVATLAPVGLLMASAQFALAAARNLTHDGLWLSGDVPDILATPPSGEV